MRDFLNIVILSNANLPAKWRSIMSGCCGGSSKSEPVKVAVIATPLTDAPAEQPAEKSSKNECCDNKPAKNEKHGCGCC